MIINLRNQEIRNERIQIENDRGNELVDLDSNMYINENDADGKEDDSLLSRSILEEEYDDNINMMEEDLSETDNGDGEILENEVNERDISDNESEGRVIDDVRDRFKSMILEGLGKKHWDSETRMCLEAEEEHLEVFAERTMNDIILNEDLKCNLQKAMSDYNLKFNITLAIKTQVTAEITEISIQRLIYFSEKKKKKNEVLNMKWSKPDKVDYQKWIRDNFEVTDSSQAQVAIRQSIRDEVEEDMTDETIQTKKESQCQYLQ
jgi:hypothetical protein